MTTARKSPVHTMLRRPRLLISGSYLLAIVVTNTAVIGGLTPGRADDNGVTEPPHFVNETEYMKMSKAERLIYVRGAFDGFLVGFAAAKAGWNIDWVDKCLDSLTDGDLRAATDKDAQSSAQLEIDGAPTSDHVGGGSGTYNGLLTVCKH